MVLQVMWAQKRELMRYVRFLIEYSVTIHWKDKNDQVTTTPANIGASLLEVAHKHGIDLEGKTFIDILPLFNT